MMKKLSLIFSMVLFFAGCKVVNIQGGHLPSEFLDKAKQFEGRYAGAYEGKSAEIHLFLRGDQPVLTFSDGESNDLLGAECSSQVGHLKSLLTAYRNSQEVLDQMEFELDPGQCPSVQGRSVLLRLPKKNQIELKILDHTEWEDECDSRFPPPYDGHRCGKAEVPVYREGFFRKYR